MLARRKFLKIMGVSTAAAPLAAKEALETKATEFTTFGNRHTGNMITGGTDAPLASGGPSDMTGAYLKQIAWSTARGGRLPSFVEDEVRRMSKFVTYLDHDIASKRSWSLAAKVHEQRQRNYKREIERVRNPGGMDIAQEAFEKVAGFRWRIW